MYINGIRIPPPMQELYTRKELEIMYNTAHMSNVQYGNPYQCCIKNCRNYALDNTYERFCSKHWDEHVKYIINWQPKKRLSYKQKIAKYIKQLFKIK